MLQHFFRMCVTAAIVIICSACARTIAIYGGKKKFTNATMTTTARPTSGRATINDQYIYIRTRLNFVSFTSLVFDDRQQTEYVIDDVGLLARLCGHRCRAHVRSLLCGLHKFHILVYICELVGRRWFQKKKRGKKSFGMCARVRARGTLRVRAVVAHGNIKRVVMCNARTFIETDSRLFI